MDYINKSINIVGYSGPVLLFISTIYLLTDKQTYITIYIIGFLFNIILNFLLKGLIQQPRPNENPRLFNLELLKGDIINYDRYGMPSGHAQTMFYSTIFIFLVLKNKTIAVVYLLFSFMTMYQRVQSESHTPLQVIVGSCVGSMMGFLVYQYGKQMLKGILKSKQDDDAPI